MQWLVLLALLPGLAAAPLKKWQVLGPFVVGKNELDGEPWKAQTNGSRANGANVSELGDVQVTSRRAEANGLVAVQWEVDWQSLVSFVGGHELLEWQALAWSSFKAEGLVQLRCQGVAAFTVDDNITLVGDLYFAQLPPHPVHLSPGSHRLSIRLRGKLKTQFSCHLEKVKETSSKILLFGESFLAVPDLLVLESEPSVVHVCGERLALGVANQDLKEWITELRPILLSPGRLSLAAEQPATSPLAPGQMARIPVNFEANAGATCNADEEVMLELAFEGKIAGRVLRSGGLKLRLKCRHAKQSFVFTFQDVDGSTQHAAAVMPQSCKGDCPVLVTLSGTSISARDSADAYKMKHKKDKDYRFGFKDAWLLAPTRHGAHNWEGPGLLTAIHSLDALRSFASRGEHGLPSVDVGRVLVAGHSMGGHGAWLFACHMDVLGVISSASWLRKDQYSDSNKVFLHDVATAFVEPTLAALLRQAELDFDVEAQAASLVHLPVLIRVGSRDRTSHPWFSRRIYRTLRSLGAQDVTLSEIPDKEHWWWDTDEPNDGGAVNDPEIRHFVARVLTEQAAETPRSWRLLGMASKGGLSLWPQRADRQAEVFVELPEGSAAVLRTSNVRRLQWRPSPQRQGVKQALVDGELLVVPEDEVASWCLQDDRWQLCGKLPLTERHARQAGPLRRIISQRLCGLADEEGQEALRFFGNMLLMTGHGGIRQLSMQEAVDDGVLVPPEECEALLVLGTPMSNPAAAALLKGQHGLRIPLMISENISLGDCTWQGEMLAALSLLPWWTTSSEPRLALLASGTSSQSAAQALMLLATPTIPPMARQPLTHLLPDYVVLDVEETRAKGAGGYLAAGFWSHDWQRLPSAYERCWRGRPGSPAAHAIRSEL
ncbi:Uncharacterized secreted protein ARB_06907 [Durusdinium trenchii]|uniref:Uncharacterized secreted protein ARB_06907 n=1 Tax=Durusdinium trenchii TaxID=1381693 RepID=A0ABP0KU03_9DINO